MWSHFLNQTICTLDRTHWHSYSFESYFLFEEKTLMPGEAIEKFYPTNLDLDLVS